MQKLFKFIPLLLLLCLPVIGKAQTITAAGTITDSDSVNWSSASVTITFYPAPAYPNPGSYTVSGVPITNYGLTFTGMTNSSGAFSIAGIPNTTLISPSGSNYKIQICPNASVQCTILPPLALSGQSLTAYINSLIKPIRFAAQGANTWGYMDGEVSPLPVQGAFYFNVISGVSRQWNGSIWQNFGGSGGTCTGCVIEAPAAGVNQQITQQGTTSLDANTLLGIHWVNNYYYPSNNGFGTLGSSSVCTFATSGTSGCSLAASPYYASTEIPDGWYATQHPFGGSVYGFANNPGTAAYDYRNGQFSMFFHDPFSTAPRSTTGFTVVTQEDKPQITQYQTGLGNYLVSFNPQMLVYTGGNNFNNYFNGIPQLTSNEYFEGVDLIEENWSSGILFGIQEIVNQHGVGDSFLQWERLTCDGGINTTNDEGCKGVDELVTEDPMVATGTLSTGGGVTGPTLLNVNFTIGGGTQGQDRLAIDTSRINFSGTHWTGGSGSLNNYPPTIADSTQTYPVSTMISICYAGSDNGAGGAAGCPASGSPSGYIPGQVNSNTQFSPLPSITVGIDTSTTTNLPTGFCNSSNAQSSNSGGSCYIPSSGAACLTSTEEYETVNYTYNSTTQQITLLNLRFPHSNNGLTFATGGLCGSVVEDRSNVYSGGGTTGVIDPVYPIEGSVDAHTIYYITQRTNEGYGLPLLGGSSDGGSYNGGSGIPGTAGAYGALCFNTGMSGFSLSGGTVTFNMNSPAGTSNPFPLYNSLPVTISGTGNSSYEGTWRLTFVNSNTFTYTPTTTPSGTIPTTGTVAYCNANYNIMPGARILSVDNQSGGLNHVDGTLILMPNEMSTVVNGDTIRVPHFQQMAVQGNNVTVEKFQPEQYVGQNDYAFNFTGNITGPEPGVHVNNSNGINYLGLGGTYQMPYWAFFVGGYWDTTLTTGTAPRTSVISVTGCIYANCNSPIANFDLFKFPDLIGQGAVPGQSEDYLNYDPYYKISVRNQGLYTGRIYCGQQGGGGVVMGDGSLNSLCTFQAGYLNADQAVTSPTVSTNNFFTTQLGNPTVYANTVGASGTTTITYYAVSHALANPTKAVIVPYLFTAYNAPNTLTLSNYVLICFPHQAGIAYYDILKTVTSNSIVTGLSATVPNGSSFGQVASYSCAKDTGQTTSLYVPSATNTTGGENIAGPSNAESYQASNLTTPGLLQSDINGNILSTGIVAVTPVTFTIASFTIPANTSEGNATVGAGNPATFSMPGLPASGTYIHINPTGNPATLIGWGSTGGLNIWAWPSGTAGTANYIIQNPTANPITLSTITFSAAVN